MGEFIASGSDPLGPAELHGLECADIPLCICSWMHCKTAGGARMQIVFIACGWSSGDISVNINSVK